MLRTPLFLAASLGLLLGAAKADSAHDELWSLYVYEQASAICGLEMSEDEENDLDDAQHRARLRLSLSRQEAAELYRRARASVAAARDEMCGEPERLQLGLRAPPANPG